DLSGIEEIILLELNSKGRNSEICYRQGRRYAAALEEIKNYGQNADEKFFADSEKVYVVTGGTRGIGAEMAKHLVEKGARKLVLMGRTEFPKRELWESILSDKTSDPNVLDRIKGVRSLEERGARVILYTGSLADEKKLDSFFSRVRKDHGEISGVIHCGGLVSHENPAFINKHPDEIKRVFEPKVEGLRVLHKVFSGDRLQFFVLFSSVSALIPELAIGLSDYAAANSYMDHFAAYQHGNCCRYYKSINWPSWKDVGMGEAVSAKYRQLGLVSITTAQGIELFEIAMGIKDSCNIFPCFVDKREPYAKNDVIRDFQSYVKKTATIENGTEADWLKEIFSSELKIEKGKLDGDTPFGDFGVDSILIASLVKRIEKKIGIVVEPSIILEYPTINRLSGYLNQNYTMNAGEKEKRDDEKLKGTDDVGPREKNEAENEALSAGFEMTSKNSGKISQKIAVIGMACHFPGARNKEEFWNNLKNGVCSITEVPRSRWDIRKYYSPVNQRGKSISKWGGFIDDIEYFDPGYFNLSSDEAPYIDPLIRKFLEVSVNTFNDAGYSKKDIGGRKVGVYVGSRVGNYSEKAREYIKSSIIGIGQNFISAHISHFFNLEGPSIVVDSACSSSLLSIHLACQSIISGECKMALAGGVDILLDEKSYIILSEGQALSPDGRCHTFDEKANGFVPGEGAGAVLLKSLDEALNDGDRIYAVIEATAVNNDGHTMGITTPNPEAQSKVIREAIVKANVNPNSISYIEAHGTGTMIGDPIELKALTRVFAEFTNERQFCDIGSVKTNIGHLLSAAGIAGFIKLALSIQNKIIPPTLHCEKPNSRFKFENSPFHPSIALKKWKPKEGVRRGGISSFGFGGTNAHIIVCELDPGISRGNEKVRVPLGYAKFNRKRYWLYDSNDIEDIKKPDESTKKSGMFALRSKRN
ncbi:MAG: SDR family NAD(P)-dependent oxidoreductase, partial [Oligoflexales bacterium]|nr:SDR family NAD(P)-dependent oxidoreductase [Oligoflexales bacterium]